MKNYSPFENEQDALDFETWLDQQTGEENDNR